MKPRWRPWVLVLSATICLSARMALLAVAGRDGTRLVTPDGKGYLALARDLRGGYLDSRSPTFPIGLQYPPGYPLFAALALGLGDDTPRALALAQTCMAIVTLPLLYALGRRLVGHPATDLAVLLLALDPASALYSVVSQPEAIFTALVVASALAWMLASDRGLRWAFMAGGLLGLAMLMRPIGILLPIAMAATAPWLHPAGRRLRTAALLLLPSLLVAGGWVARNKAVTGTAFFAGIEGANGLYYRAAGALAMSEDISVETARERLNAEEVRRGARDLDAGSRVRMEVRLMIEVLGTHPLGAAEAALHGWLRLLAGTGLTVLSALRGDPDPEGAAYGAKWLTLALALPLLVLLLGVVLSVRRWLSPGERPLLVVSLAVIGYLLAASSFLEASTRFRVPMTPFLALLSARGWTTAVRASRRGTESS